MYSRFGKFCEQCLSYKFNLLNIYRAIQIGYFILSIFNEFMVVMSFFKELPHFLKIVKFVCTKVVAFHYFPFDVCRVSLLILCGCVHSFFPLSIFLAYQFY